MGVEWEEHRLLANNQQLLDNFTPCCFRSNTGGGGGEGIERTR